MSMTDKEPVAEKATEGAVAAFTLRRPVGPSVPVICASPHSGDHYPDVLLQNLRVPLLDLRRTEDAFVDEIFSAAPEFGATLIAATHARSFVDLNRDARELDPGMFESSPPGPIAAASPRVQAGLGCFPRVGAAGENMYRGKISDSDARQRLELVHTPYHACLRQEIDRNLDEFGCAILLDCHSMPSQQPGRRDLPDIVLGDRFGSSCTSQLTNLVERSFRSAGYTVVRNAPYAGGYTTRRYGRPKRQVHVLQIEINRGLYMDEVQVTPTATMQSVMGAVRQVLADVSRLSARLSS